MKNNYTDVQELGRFFESLSPQQIEEANAKEEERLKTMYDDFVNAFKRDACSFCGKPLKIFSSGQPCLHYLLRQNGSFKKKHFKDIYAQWGYFNISSYLRWVANLERYVGNINNLEDEKNTHKKFEYTIRWKNIDWTFSCANTDFAGHDGTNSDYPHYHFQMRIDNRSFIDFTDFHVPFSDEDLFNFASIENDYMHHSWGNGIGMQEALDLMDSLPDKGIDTMRVSASDERAQFRVQTLIDGPMNGDELVAMIEESNRTGKTLASLAQQKFQEGKVITSVSPIETIPDIAARKRGRGGKQSDT